MADTQTKLKQTTTPSQDKFDHEKVVHTLLKDVDDIEADRLDWMDNQQLLDDLFEARQDPSHALPWDNAADYADPTMRTMTNTMYARVFRAILGPELLVEPVPIEESDVDKIDAVRVWINWQLMVNANRGRGAQFAIAKWAYMFCKNGTAIMKVSPGIERRVVKETRNITSTKQVTDPFTGQSRLESKTRKRTTTGEKTLWEGPMLTYIPREDFLIAPRYFDDDAIEMAPVCGHRIFLSSDTLRKKADKGIYLEDVVEEILKAETGGDPDQRKRSQPDRHVQNTLLKEASDDRTGVDNLHGSFEPDLHEILELYAEWDVNDDGFDEQVIFWIHRDSRKILKWTYLEEIYPDNKRPFIAAFYNFNESQFYVDGIPGELQSTQEEINYMRNQRVNKGTITTMPAGWYDPTLGMSPEKLFFEPGVFMPIPGGTLNTFNFPDRTGFDFREEGALKQNVREAVGIGDIQLGSVDPGSTFFRTASGPISTIQEANIRFAVKIKMFQWAFREMAQKVYALTVGMAKPGMTVRITGDVNVPNSFALNKDNLDAINGRFDFVHKGSADTAFPSIQTQKALQLVQLTSDPIAIQLGIVTPRNIYEARRDALRRMGIRDTERYVTKPPQSFASPKQPGQVIGLIAQGMPVEPSPLDNIEENLAFIQAFMGTPDADVILGDDVKLKLLEDYTAAAFQILQQQRAAAAAASIPGNQGNNGQLGLQSPRSSANDNFAAQPTNPQQGGQ